MTARPLPLLALLALAAPAGAAPGSGAGPVLVHDVNTTPLDEGMVPDGSHFSGGLEIDGVLYFAARDRAHGNELWRSDGTAAGTWRVDDVCPGPCDADPVPLAALGGRLLFAAGDGVHGVELWSTDERPGSAEPIHEATPGPNLHYAGFGAAGFVELDGWLFFEERGAELWRTDGTRAGTERAMTLEVDFLLELTPVAGELFFWAYSPQLGAEIWRSDGTAAGTSVATDLCEGPLGCRPSRLVALGERLVFAVEETLWALDAASGATVALTTLDDPLSFRPVAWNGRLYFADGAELLETDGTPDGTRSLAELAEPLRFAAALPEALLVASYERVWGLTSPDEAPAPLFAGDLLTDHGQPPLTRVGDRAFFRVFECLDHHCDRTRVTELWTSDGTQAGTRKVTDLCGGIVSCRDEYHYQDPRGAAAVTDRYLFVVDSRKTGNELWRSDGTAAGTRLVKDIWTDPGSADPDLPPTSGSTAGRHAPVALGDRLVFPALHSTVEDQRWRAENRLWSTAAGGGATPVGPVAERVDGLAVLGDAVLFNQGFELWRFGAETGALELLSAQAGPSGVSLVHRDRLYFSAGRCDDELWISDGTAAGTRLLGEFSTGSCEILPWASGIPGPVAGVGDAIAFHASDGYEVGDGLWTADAAGEIRILAELAVSAGAGNPGAPAMAGTGSRVVFGAVEYGQPLSPGLEPWVSDGTAEGTRSLADLRPGREGSLPHDFVAFRGEVAFIAAPGGIEAGESLWTTEGGASGIRRISELATGGGPSWARHLTVVGERLFFVATNEGTGPELWASDGTAAGTGLVADLRLGPRGSYPQSLAAVGGLLVFSADDGASGLEAWVSDGTAAGTRRLADVAPGRDASSPSDFTRAGDRLYFWADEAVHGRELRALPVAALEGPGPGGGPGGPAPEPPPGEWLTSSALPGFRAKARITPPGQGPLAGRSAADCIAETLCVEGALAGRPEAFLKVIGPRPNGFLWVQISRFTPSEIELWVEQTATGELRYYRLPAVGPGDPDVSGLQDRQAFRP